MEFFDPIAANFPWDNMLAQLGIGEPKLPEWDVSTTHHGILHGKDNDRDDVIYAD